MDNLTLAITGASERAQCVHSYFAALEYEREWRFSLADEELSRVLKSDPEWLAPYAECHGLSGKDLLKRLSLRRRLYRAPFLFIPWAAFERLATQLRWLRLSMSVRLASHAHLHRGAAVGTLTATPNPVYTSSPESKEAAVMLAWKAVLAKAVELRIGRPDGPLLSHGAPAGQTVTGEWVVDGTVVFLQDAGGVPLTVEHTLAVVRVRVRPQPLPHLPPWFSPKRWSDELRWLRLRLRVHAAAHLRLERGGAVGYLRGAHRAKGPFTRSARRLRFAVEWTSAGTQAVEVRLNAPNGRLISRTGTSGSARIGAWAHDGSILYLQDASNGRALTSENTLDVLRIRV